MKNLLYIGNALSSKGKTITTIESLSEYLKETYSVKIASKKSNKILRLLDMVKLVLVNSSKTDVVLIDTYSTFNFYYAFVISQLCRILRIKYITILHGGKLENRLKGSSKLSRLIFNNAYKLIAPSNFLKSVFENHGYNNIEYIPNTIQISDYPFIEKKYEIPRLLWVRSFSKIYNPKLAIQVFNDLKKSYPEATLCMVGPDADGTLKEAKQLALKHNLNVEFMGKLTKKEWVLLSEKYNIFINTTNFDNTPVSVIEAMALGLPIVSTNVGGLPFLIKNNIDGILVKPQNTDAMVKAILKIQLNEDLRNRLVINARSKAENFAWKAVKPKWETLLS